MHYQNKQFVHFNIHVGKCSINLVTLLKAQYVILIKYPKTTITLLYILLFCLLSLSQMFLRMFKSREIINFT